MEVSHLFFVDDIILVAKASTKQANEIKRVMNLFYSASGQ